MCWLFRGHLVGQSTCWLLCNLQYFTSNCVRQLCPRNWQRLLAKAISDNRRRRRKIATGNLPDYKSLDNLIGFYFCCARDLVVTQYIQLHSVLCKTCATFCAISCVLCNLLCNAMPMQSAGLTLPSAVLAAASSLPEVASHS